MADAVSTGGDGGHFSGKVAIVTGAASGIGKAVAAGLAARGATVVLADIDEAGARAAAAATGGEAAALDVTDAGQVRALVDGTVARHGRLDLMFNNAGVGAGGPVETLELAEWARVIDIDLNSVIYGVAAAYPHMVRQESGHIVNTASLAGLIPTPLLTPYATVKHAVVGLSVSLRVEAAAYGVRVERGLPRPGRDAPAQPARVGQRPQAAHQLAGPAVSRRGHGGRHPGRGGRGPRSRSWPPAPPGRPGSSTARRPRPCSS